MSIDENSCSFLLVPAPKMMTATSTEQSTESSWAFLKRPPFRLRKVLGVESTVSRAGRAVCVVESPYTERFLSSLMGLISIFLRPIVMVAAQPRRR